MNPKLLKGKIAVFGAQRSGTTWIGGLLQQYLAKRVPGSKYLAEYFNSDLLRNPFRRNEQGVDCFSDPRKIAAGTTVYDYVFEEGRIKSITRPYLGYPLDEEMDIASLQRLMWL